MFKPEFEVMDFGKDLIYTSDDGCPNVCVKLCGWVVCNAECGSFCEPECGSVYDVKNEDKRLNPTKSTEKASPKNVVGFDMTFDK